MEIIGQSAQHKRTERVWNPALLFVLETTTQILTLFTPKPGHVPATTSSTAAAEGWGQLCAEPELHRGTASKPRRSLQNPGGTPRVRSAEGPPKTSADLKGSGNPAGRSGEPPQRRAGSVRAP